MTKIAIATILLAAAACTTTNIETSSPAPSDGSGAPGALWECTVYAHCAVDPEVTTMHQLCAAPSSSDVQEPGDAAAADAAQLLGTECNVAQGTAPSDDGTGHACEAGVPEPWSCRVECAPLFRACTP